MIEINRHSVAIKNLYIKRCTTDLSTVTKHGDIKNVIVNTDNMSQKCFVHANCIHEKKHFKIKGDYQNFCGLIGVCMNDLF